MVLCKCGCGEETKIYRGKPREYIHNHHMRGKKLLPLSEEHKDKISKKLLGRKLPLNTIEKMKLNRVGMSGKKHSQETKDKISESRKNKSCGKDNYWHGKHLPDDMKKRISYTVSKNENLHNRIGNKNPAYGKPSSKFAGTGKGQYYNSPLQGKIWLRSSYELAYAKYLDSINELWYYEIETFDLGNCTYTPDFFLPRTDKFIEIKGYMSSIAQEKISKFLEQYPWDLEILYEEDLIKLGIDL